MPAIHYDPRWRSVVNPGAVEDFFTHGSSSSDAALCAEMSRLAYAKEKGQLRDYLERSGFTLVDAIGYEKPGTQFFVARSSGAIEPIAVVAFRGTDDPRDWITDITFNPVPWHGDGQLKDGGRVASGFYKALPDLDTLTRLIPEDVRVLYTGHSLGAALATLAVAQHPHGDLYTFGSPRVGDKQFKASMDGVKHLRYVDCCDGVTLVPAGLGYVHVGDLQYIDRNGRAVPSPPEKVIHKDQVLARIMYLFKYAWHPCNVTVRWLADHAPINYLSAVMGLRS
jgi:hypothetical protein